MRRLFILINLILLLAVLMFLAGCSRAKDPKEISIGYVNWSEGIAMSYLAKAMLEEQGYKVTLKNADIAPIFTSVAAGKVDLFLDAWLPDTHVDYMKKYGDRLETIGVPFEKARLGLAVPSYVTINTIEELNANKERFKNEIIGIDIGASLMNLTEKAVDEYGLQLALMPSSGPTMAAFLQKSVEHNDWIVVTGWTPHWMFSRYDLKFLEDSKGVFGNAEHIEAVATKGFSETHPYVAAFFKNFRFTNEQLSELMDIMEEYPLRESEGAKVWLQKHPEIVDLFLPSQTNKLTQLNKYETDRENSLPVVGTGDKQSFYEGGK